MLYPIVPYSFCLDLDVCLCVQQCTSAHAQLHCTPHFHMPFWSSDCSIVSYAYSTTKHRLKTKGIMPPSGIWKSPNRHIMYVVVRLISFDHVAATGRQDVK